MSVQVQIDNTILHEPNKDAQIQAHEYYILDKQQ